MQNQDLGIVSAKAEQCVTAVKPSEDQLEDLNFTWRIVKHVKSNAIVVGKAGMVYGVGAGQMNRIGSAEIALKQAARTLAEEAAAATGVDADTLDEKEVARKAGLVLASDAFFPFDDCVTLAAEYGVKAIVQPGGSVRDADSVKKCDELGITMLFTGERHFKH